MTTWPLQKDCAAYYGDPRGKDGGASAAWERSNLVTVKCPWVLRYDGKPVSGIRIHRKCADSLARVLDDIWQRCGRSQAEIDRIGMSTYGGSYNFRNKRGASSLSMHAYGCAVDFDPARNALGNHKPAMDRRVIEAFEREGWEWGGHWSRPDGMHFQAARTREKPKRLAPVAATKVPVIAVGDKKPAANAEPFPLAVYRPEVERLQWVLKDLGYHEVGLVDGKWGSRTRGALLAFKADNGLPLTPDVSDDLWAALAKAEPRKIAPEREAATEAPSEAAKAAKAAKTVGGTVAVVGAVETALSPFGGLSGIVGWISGVGDAASAIGNALSPIKQLAVSIIDNWPVVLVLGGIGLFFIGRSVFADELESFRNGEWS